MEITETRVRGIRYMEVLRQGLVKYLNHIVYNSEGRRSKTQRPNFQIYLPTSQAGAGGTLVIGSVLEHSTSKSQQ